MRNQINYKWDGIDWEREADSVISRRVTGVDADGCVVMRGGKPRHPTRERVRQRRMQEYFGVLERSLSREGLGELDVRVQGMIRKAMSGGTLSERARAMKPIHGLELPVDSVIGQDLAQAMRILRPAGWHSQRSAAKDCVAELPTSTMTIGEIAKAVGVSYCYASQLLTKLGLGFKSQPKFSLRKYDWESIMPYEWDGPEKLSNRVIAQRLGIKNSAVVAVYRHRRATNLSKAGNRIGFRKDLIELEEIPSESVVA